MHGARNIKGGLILIAFGIAAGLGMSAYAFDLHSPHGELRERLLRLAHVSAIMLPLLNVVLGMFLDRLRLSGASKSLASWLLLAGAVTLPLALAAAAHFAPGHAVALSGLPAAAFSAGVFMLGVGAGRTEKGVLAGDALYSVGECPPRAGSRSAPAGSSPSKAPTPR